MAVRAIASLLACFVVGGCGGDDADDGGESGGTSRGLSIAVIGDTPYGAAQVANFRRDIRAINADREVRLVIHLGDIQEGPSRCEDGYLERIRRDFDTFEDPLVYTPGDNEWTDCHRPPKGGRSPLERLARVRSIFFDRPGRSLGRRSRRLQVQRAPFVENVRWAEDRVVLTTLHVPGSNNGLDPWTGAAGGQKEHYRSRLEANLEWLNQAFDVADRRRAAAVVVAMQADMWPPLGAQVDTSGYAPIVRTLARRARAFRRPVLVLQGDSHRFKVGSPLIRSEEGRTTAPNLIRVVVQGADSTPRQWLRVRLARTREVFSLDPVPFER